MTGNELLDFLNSLTDEQREFPVYLAVYPEEELSWAYSILNTFYVAEITPNLIVLKGANP